MTKSVQLTGKGKLCKDGRPRKPYVRKKPAMAASKAQVARILDRAIDGCTPTEIGKEVLVNVDEVHRVLKLFEPIFPKLPQVEYYRKHKHELLDAGTLQLLESVLEPSGLAKARPNENAYALKVVHEIGRLEKGLSTANISSKVQFTNIDLDKLK